MERELGEYMQIFTGGQAPKGTWPRAPLYAISHDCSDLLLFGIRLCKVPGGKIWMQLQRVISSDLYRARGFVSFAFLCKPRPCGEELPKGEDCQGVKAWDRLKIESVHLGRRQSLPWLSSYWGLRTERWGLSTSTEYWALSTKHWADREHGSSNSIWMSLHLWP